MCCLSVKKKSDLRDPMKRVFGISLLLVLSLNFAAAQQAPAVTSGLRKTNDKKDNSVNVEKAKEVMVLVTQILKDGHYSGHALNDENSKKIFELFINRIDPGKYLLLAEDIATLKKMENSIDDELATGTMVLEPESLKIKNMRIEQVEKIYQNILASPIDVTKSKTMIKDPKDMPWCNSQDELTIRWQQIIHQMVVSNYIYLLIEKENTRLAELKKLEKASEEKKETPKVESAPLDEDSLIGDDIEMGKEKPIIDYAKLSKLPLDEAKLKESQDKMKKMLDVRFKRLKEEGEVGNFNTYMNALCGAFDPHTDYMMPAVKESFDIELTGALQGIGAQLSEDGEDVKVVKIIPGSASWKQKQLTVGDIVLKVAQGSLEAVDIRGMSLNESVRLIRGKKGTEVRLTVKKIDGQTMIIPIIRDIVVLEDSYVHTEIVEDKITGQKVGYILLPSFYLEQENGNGRSCAADVKKELIALKEKNVDGIVFDLRSNGGGSLKDVVEMAGFFIASGPIVQVRGSGGYRKVLEDPDNKVIYDGPLVVLVSNMSASASEIFAAALQDYGRAVVLGSGFSSFGKGTVQTFISLQDYSSNKNFDIGSLKLSIQKFYRINGQTTQFKGVIPDIVLPVEYMYMDYGEKFLDNPLPSDVFFPSNYEKWVGGPNIASLKELSAKRIASNIYLAKVGEYALFLKNRREEKSMKVSVAENFKELEEAQKKNNEFKKLKESKREIKLSRVTVVNNNESGMFTDIEKMLPKDQYVFEAIDIIKDIKSKPVVEAK